MSKTIEALKSAIQIESQATSKYKSFARTAFKEGFPNIGKLFTALAYAEQIHIHNHQNALGEKYQKPISEESSQKTEINLQKSIEAEIKEATELYPAWIKLIKSELKSEQAKLANLSMDWARQVEKTHASLLEIALKSLQNGKDFTINQIWICRACGDIFIDSTLTEICPVCGHDRQFFHLITETDLK